MAEPVKIRSEGARDTRALGEMLGRSLKGGEILFLTGPLGAGKTTFVQGLAAGLDVKGPVQSPSFVLERIHRGRLLLRHLDFYRLTAEDIEEAGFFDQIDASTVTVIEWAERAAGAPEPAFQAEFSFVPGVDDARDIVFFTTSSEWSDKIHDARERLRGKR